MKPTKYIKLYNLNNHNSFFDPKDFIRDLTKDFNSMIDHHNKPSLNKAKIKLCIKDIRKKFESIYKTNHPLITDQLWNYFCASVICSPKNAILYGIYVSSFNFNNDFLNQITEESKQYE